MSKREKLAQALYETRDKSEDGKRERVFYAGEWDAQVDAFLDELMEPGEGAIIAGALAMSGAMSHGEVGAAVIYGQPKDVWQAILTHIKDGKP